jgi:hypothetical protein
LRSRIVFESTASGPKIGATGLHHCARINCNQPSRPGCSKNGYTRANATADRSKPRTSGQTAAKTDAIVSAVLNNDDLSSGLIADIDVDVNIRVVHDNDRCRCCR